MLIVDNFSHSPIVTAIFCFAFTAVTHPLRQAFPTCLTKSSVVRTMLSALCLLQGIPTITSCSRPRGCHSPHLHLHRSLERRNAPTFGLVSPSSRSSAQASRIYAFATWCMKEVGSAARCGQPPALQGRRPSFRERGRDPPQSSSVCGDGLDSVVTADLCSTSDTHTTQKRWVRERFVVSSRARYAC